MCKLTLRKTLTLCVVIGARLALGQTAPGRYALILDDTPFSERFASKQSSGWPGGHLQQQIAKRQNASGLNWPTDEYNYRLRRYRTQCDLRAGSAGTGRRAEVLPGVKGVVPMKRYHMSLNRATQVLNAPAAWNALGGLQGAGQGVKIGVLRQRHRSDSSRVPGQLVTDAKRLSDMQRLGLLFHKQQSHRCEKLRS